MALLIAIGLGVFSILAGKAGKKGIALAAGILAILTTVYWFQTGPGFSVLDWLDNPTGPTIPDSVQIPGR